MRAQEALEIATTARRSVCPAAPAAGGSPARRAAPRGVGAPSCGSDRTPPQRAQAERFASWTLGRRTWRAPGADVLRVARRGSRPAGGHAPPEVASCGVTAGDVRASASVRGARGGGGDALGSRSAGRPGARRRRRRWPPRCGPCTSYTAGGTAPHDVAPRRPPADAAVTAALAGRCAALRSDSPRGLSTASSPRPQPLSPRRTVGGGG